MKKTSTTKIIAIILAFVMLFSILTAVLTSVIASANVTRAEIDRLREEQRYFERRRQETQSEINSIQFEARTETARKNVLDDRIMWTGHQINNLMDIIAQYELLIIDKEYAVGYALDRENEQLDRYRMRVRDLEENGVIHLLEILFNFNSFADLLARIDFIGEIMRGEERLYNDLIIARNETEHARTALEETKQAMEYEYVLLQFARTELYDLRYEAEMMIWNLLQQEEAERALHEEFRQSAARLQQEINRAVAELQRQEEAARAAAAAARAAARPVNIVQGTGEFTWPVPSSRNVTSGFGTRQHPVFGTVRQHNGIDIAANHGASVVAADTGTVITSRFDSAYGNVVVIAHGNGRTTLYAHLSTRSVSRGDVVQRGQQIGLIGSTGISTGPHLHFEVSVNGQRVNPMRYL